MRIVFMGTPEFAVPSLEALLTSGDQVVGVVTQPDRPKGRGQDVIPSPVKIVCQREGIPVLQPLKMKDPAFLDALRQWKPDVIAVTAFGRILPPVILALPPRGCINVHGSLLPKYRGAGPVQWAIIRGERETGITTMFMAEGMDTGDMLLRETVEIRPDDTAGTLAPRLAEVGGRLLVETLRRLTAGTLTPERQDDSQATMAPLLKKEDGQIDWTLSAADIANRVRGLSPWPGAFTSVNGERWTLWRVAVGDELQRATPGTITKVTKDCVDVATGRGTIHILDIQPSNSRRMTMAQYLAGHRVSEGISLQAGLPPQS
ncbi:MAG: methionyl-tRNA formyltransferase [Nitrospira sp. CR1.1]|nr:methionyl-tRNA formyltransferase [Nitrospira sp. CR1.1]